MIKKISYLIFIITASCSSISSQDNKIYETIKLNKTSDRAIINQAVKDKKKITVIYKSDTRVSGSGVINIEGIDKKIEISSIGTFLGNQTALASNDLFAGCVTQDMNLTILDAITQFGGFNKEGKITLMYDSGAPSEFNSINYLGLGMISTYGTIEDRKFIEQMVQKTKNKCETLYWYGCGAGGMRNYNNLVSTKPKSFLDKNGRSTVAMKFYKTPVYNRNLETFTELSGAKYLGHHTESGDASANILGGNNGIIELFIAIFNPDNWKFKKPHVVYYCEGEGCNYNNKNPFVTEIKK